MVINNKEFSGMAFSPTQSPVYGGDTLTVVLGREHLLQVALPASSPATFGDSRFFVVFEGSRRRHVVSAWPKARPRGAAVSDSEDDLEDKDSNICLEAVIPGHDIAEDVRLTLVQLSEEEEEILEEEELIHADTNEDEAANHRLQQPNSRVDLLTQLNNADPEADAEETVTVTVRQTHTPVASVVFRYEYDSTFYLTKFLVSSVFNDHALDNLELIKSDRFDLSNEVLSTLDVRLSRALRNANLTSGGWHVLGGDSINDAHCEERETLLHLCARLGLRRVAHYLLERPGSEDALRLPNRQGELPSDLAAQNGFNDLAELLSGYNTHGMVTAQPDVVEMENAVLRNYGDGTASLTSYLDSPSLDRSVEQEINFLRETEEMIRVQRGLLPQGGYNSDWPGPGALHHHTGASRSLPTLVTLEGELEASLDRVLKQQNINRDNLHAYLRGSSSATALPRAPPGQTAAGDALGSFTGVERAASLQESRGVDFASAGYTSIYGEGRELGGSGLQRYTTHQARDQGGGKLDSQGQHSVAASSPPYSPSSPSSFPSNPGVSGQQYFFPTSPAMQVPMQHPGGSRGPSSGEEDLGSTGFSNLSGVLECSLGGVHDLTESLFQLRDAELRQRLLLRERRRRHIGRHSTSCPSLNAPLTCLSLSPIDETDHHKSMHDLVEELGSASRLSTSPSQGQRTPSPSGEITGAASPRSDTYQTHPQQDNQGDQAIRICVNGVTVDSSDDLAAASATDDTTSSATKPGSTYTGQDSGTSSQHGKNTRLRDGTDEVDTLNRRGSWCPDPTTVRTGLPFDRRDQKTRLRMLAMTGKSLSLSSLDGGEVSDEDLLSSPTEEHPQIIGDSQPLAARPPVKPPTTTTTTATVVRQVRQHRQQYHRAVRTHSDAEIETEHRSLSPVNSSGSSPLGREIGLSSQCARSLTDISVTVASANDSKTDDGSQTNSSGGTIGGPCHRAHHSYDDGTALVVPHTNMTKSLSTPSIPQATESSGSTSVRREGKQHDAKAFQSFLDDYNAQFRRQKEIEEEEEDDPSSVREKKGAEISWRDFLSEEQSPNDSDEKSNKGVRKEEKKRKPSVFSRFQSSYRTKKNKEKESKSKHRFVAISFSNATACDVCHKPMANKAALRCENCLVNVHEHNCKDQVTQCDKNRSKALQRDGSTHGAHGPRESSQGGALTEQRQSASIHQGTSLRPSQSFKDKRSSSAPVKTQPPSGQLSAPPQLSHRHSLPTSSKAISEESECDTGAGSPMETSGQSNMTDTISESMESLDGVVPSEVSWLEDEPDLQLAIEEPEAWSITVDRKTLKKLGTKDIKRQDTIWELINTEKQYVKRLKIMQKIFASAMLRDMNFSQDQVDRLFPRLDELVALHADFLRQLLARQAKNEDRFVEDIGDILLSQFQDSAADKMKSLYGVFCSKHTEAMQLYKEFLKVDRKFQNFAKKCTNLSVCEKRDISDFILGVTVRLSKYPILIEAILKSTKDKKDRENMSRALLMSKEVVQHVDEKVAAYEKLLDIISRMDSRAVTFKGKKFKRQDLNAEGRELVYSGKIGWKSARGRIYDVLAVVLTDIIVFLQKNEQKYTFLMQDNKSCVIRLYRLLVREKRDARGSLGIYMISPNRITPEMYELVCSSKGEREDWIRILQEAIQACPPEADPLEQWAGAGGGGASAAASTQAAAAAAQAASLEQERREERNNQVKLLIERLHEKDDAIKVCCDEKSKLMLELLELSTPRNQPGSRPSSQEIVSANESVDIVQAAMEEASRLTNILQGSGTQLSRSVSSVGEHHSSTFVATPIPKRAETFAGFDSSHDSPKMSAMKQKFTSGQESETIPTTDSHRRAPSEISLDQPEGDNSVTILPEVAQNPSHYGTAGSTQQSVTSSQLSSSSAHLWEEPQPPHIQQQQPPLQPQLQHHALLGSDRSSDRESLGELSAASVSSLVIPASPSPSNHEQMTSMFHLVQYLNTLMNLTSKQCTKVESLRAELAEAKSEIAKLSADMQQQQSGGSFYGGGGGGSGVGPGGRRGVYRHDQLEELRNLQENISRERQEWENIKSQDRAQLEHDRQQLEEERHQLEKDKNDLRSRKEDLKRQREALQRQIDMMREQGYVVSSPFAESLQQYSGGDMDLRDAKRQQDYTLVQQPQLPGRAINHRRSASADFYSTVGISDVENIQSYPNPALSGEPQLHQGKSRQQPRLSVGSLSSSQQGGLVSKPPQQPGLPMHLLSARNEQRMGGVNVQKLPLKLSGGSNSGAAAQLSAMSPNAMVTPSAAFCAGVQQPFPGRSGGVSRVQSMSASSRAALAQHSDNSRNAPSNLARVMKLADPKGKPSTSSSSPNNPGSSSTSTSSPSGAGKGPNGNPNPQVSPTGKPPHPAGKSGKPGGSPGAPGAPGAPGGPVSMKVTQSSREGPDGIIYF